MRELAVFLSFFAEFHLGNALIVVLPPATSTTFSILSVQAMGRNHIHDI